MDVYPEHRGGELVELGLREHLVPDDGAQG